MHLTAIGRKHQPALCTDLSHHAAPVPERAFVALFVGYFVRQIDNDNEFACESCNIQKAHNLLLMLGSVHAQKAQRLPFIALTCLNHVQPTDAAKRRADGVQIRFNTHQIVVCAQSVKCGF